jgi:hypothetical protein
MNSIKSLYGNAVSKASLLFWSFQSLILQEQLPNGSRFPLRVGRDHATLPEPSLSHETA